MSIIIDLIVIAIIIIMALISAKRGFVRVAVEVVGFIAAIIVATTFSLSLANTTYDKVIEPPILNSITNVAGENVSQTVDATWEALPNFIKNNSEKFNVSKDDIGQNISLNAQQNIKETTKSVLEHSVKPIAVNILKMLYSVIIAVVLIIVVKFLAKFINKLFSFSVVGKLNSTLGGILGVVKGLVAAWLFCTIVYLIISFTKNGIWIFNAENIENTTVFKFLAELIHI